MKARPPRGMIPTGFVVLFVLVGVLGQGNDDDIAATPATTTTAATTHTSATAEPIATVAATEPTADEVVAEKEASDKAEVDRVTVDWKEQAALSTR